MCRYYAAYRLGLIPETSYRTLMRTVDRQIDEIEMEMLKRAYRNGLSSYEKKSL